MFFRLFCALISIHLLFACQSSETPAKDDTTTEKQGNYVIAVTEDPRIDRAKLHDEVMNIHDEVMPKMSEINRLKRGLKGKLEIKDAKAVKAKKRILQTIKELDDASEAMMLWMREFKQPAEDAPHEEAMAQLESEKDKISKVSEMMLKSIENAKNLRTELTVE